MTDDSYFSFTAFLHDKEVAGSRISAVLQFQKQQHAKIIPGRKQ